MGTLLEGRNICILFTILLESMILKPKTVTFYKMSACTCEALEKKLLDRFPPNSYKHIYWLRIDGQKGFFENVENLSLFGQKTYTNRFKKTGTNDFVKIWAINSP